MSDWLMQHRTEALRRRALQLSFNLAAVRTEIALLKARLAVVQAEKVLARHCRRQRMTRLMTAAADVVEVESARTARAIADLLAAGGEESGPEMLHTGSSGNPGGAAA
jgi:hypothetical protein